MLGAALHLPPIMGSGWDFFGWLREEQSLASEEQRTHPRCAVAPGIATGKGAAFNERGCGMRLGVGRAELFRWVCVTHL